MINHLIESEIIEKSENIEVTLETTSIAITSEKNMKIDSLWESATKKNPNLFNGKALVYTGYNKIGDRINIKVGLTHYKYIFASILHPELNLGLRPLAVSGMVIDNSSNSIIGLRHKNVTQYPEYYELIPSGGIKPDKIKESKTIDFRAQLIEEFEQEIGLKRKCIDSITSLGLIFEPYYRVYVIACIIRLNTVLSPDTLKLNENEYSSFKIISLKDLEANILRKDIHFVPTSKLILNNYDS